MQFSDLHAGYLDTGLRLRKPSHPISPPWSLVTCVISPIHPVHLVETILYQVFQVGGGNHRKLRPPLTLTLHQCKGMYSPRCAPHLPPVKICSSFHSRDVALNWLWKTNIEFNVINVSFKEKRIKSLMCFRHSDRLEDVYLRITLQIVVCSHARPS